MAPRSSATRALLGVSVGAALVLAVLALFGEGLFLSPESAAGPPAPARLQRAAEDRAAAIAVGLALYALFPVGFWASRGGRRWGRLALGVALWWMAVETLAAPHLVRHLALHQYYYARDPDHRPTAHGPGWNVHSLRGTAEPEQFGAGTLNVLFLGDSFTYGSKVRAQQAFPQVFARRFQERAPAAHLRVANLGWPSASPLLAFRRLADIGEAYHPDVVVYCLDMTDFMDDIRWGNLLQRRGMYALYQRLPIALRAFEALAPDLYARVVAWSTDAPSTRRFFVTEAPLEETRPAFAPLVGNLARIRDWCGERGVDFVLVLLPRSYQYSDRECPQNWEAREYELLGSHSLAPFAFFEELRGEVDYPILSLLEDFQTTEVFPTCHDDDPHWTPAGHGVAAAALLRELGPILDARREREGPR